MTSCSLTQQPLRPTQVCQDPTASDDAATQFFSRLSSLSPSTFNHATFAHRLCHIRAWPLPHVTTSERATFYASRRLSSSQSTPARLIVFTTRALPTDITTTGATIHQLSPPSPNTSPSAISTIDHRDRHRRNTRKAPRDPAIGWGVRKHGAHA